MTVRIHPSWHEALSDEFEKPYWHELTSFVKDEYARTQCFPLGKDIFRAFDMTPFDRVKVVILGQDPYHTAYVPVIPGLSRNPVENSGFLHAQEGQKHGLPRSSQGQEQQKPICAAMGLSFSVPSGSKAQPSLRNIFKELESDLGIKRENTDLSDWAEQGILLLNAVLTVRSGEPASHQGRGWETFTDSVIRTISEKKSGVVFLLWGNYAIAKKSLIDPMKHLIITSPHPSPFSAHHGFFGSRPFSKINTYLDTNHTDTIAWV